MATKKEEREIQFQFEAYAYDDCIGQEVQCDLCYHRFVSPGVETMLRGFIVCPMCVLVSFPEWAIKNAKETADNKERIARRPMASTPTDQRDIRDEYLSLVEDLRSVKSILEIPGGITARALAAASDTLRDHQDYLKEQARQRKRNRGKAA